jgi:hypothetical protein
MVSFDLKGQLIDQITGHHGLLEIYSHLYSGFFLFIVSLISLGVLYFYFKSSIFKYQGLLNGIFYTSLIGLGEILEHIFLGPTIGSLFHFLHLLAAPIALVFYLLSLGETFNRTPQKSSNADTKKSIAVFFLFLSTITLLSSFSSVTWDVEIEVPFVLLTTLPTLMLVGVVLEKSKIISEHTVALMSFRVMLLGVSFLAISILAGRYGDFAGKAQVYIVFHEIQNISHVITGTALFIFVVTIAQIERLMVSTKEK